MKSFMALIMLGVISFGTISGASFHTLYEARVEEAKINVVAIRLVTMSLRELTEQNI